MPKPLKLTKGNYVIIDVEITAKEIFRLIKNGDCAIFQFLDWLERDRAATYNIGFQEGQNNCYEE
jgi:hypothetical protein